ncbi:MAG TPA: cytochrome c3 family protein [Terriglobia bacterium]|nr:cytochrome c3 family protein [Terriglobia bacterium]
MAQVFHRVANSVSRAILYGIVLLIAAICIIAWQVNNSYNVYRHEPLTQPIPFSHKHHVTDDGIDCRYCHTSVETSSFAGIPPTHTCMSCHSKIWVNSPMLEPVRESYITDTSISWVRLNALPDFVYFNHSIHVAKGIGCTTCHGPIGDMPITFRENTLYMRWCINCHKHPWKYVRPKQYVFSVTYKPPKDQDAMGRRLVKEYNIKPPLVITSCYTCHR